MNRILITGANGFIGKFCLNKFIDAGYEVHGISRELDDSHNSNIHWHIADLTEVSVVRNLMAKLKCDCLLHLAWYVNPRDYLISDLNLLWVTSSLNLMKSFFENGGKRMVFAGSCFEYDLKDGLLKENYSADTQADNLYSVCKCSLRNMVEAYRKQHGVEIAWGVVFNLYGPYEHPDRLVSSVIQSIINKTKSSCTSGEQLRDFLYVEDVADAFYHITKSDITGIINIGSGKPVAVKTIIKTIIDSMHAEEYVDIGALPYRKTEPDFICADTTRINEMLGWKPKYSLAQGIEKTILWWKKKFEYR